MPDNDDDPVPEAPALCEPFFDEGRPDPLALEVLVNREGCEGERCGLGSVRDDRDMGEEDMADDPVAEHRDEREFGIVLSFLPECIDKPGLPVLPEGFFIDRENSIGIRRLFGADKK